MTRPAVPALALLPIRLFFGATFLYAGLDKLLDQSFFDPSAATSIDAQLAAFARFSPLGDLIRASLPFAGLIGLVIAVAEIGIGIGALTGLAFRVAAIGGAALSFLFFLTASWNTHPYYFGADLPYAIGWLTLTIAGHGDLWVPAIVKDAFAGTGALGLDSASRMPAGGLSARERRRRLAAKEPGRGRVALHGAGQALAGTSSPAGMAVATDPPSPERRALLQTALLAGLAGVAASFALPLRAMGLFTEPGPSRSPAPGPSTSPLAAGGSPAPGSSTVAGGSHVVARISDVQQGGGAATFTVPFDAPAPLPAGDPGIVVQLADGSFAAFDAVCTHAGCTVGWDQQDGVILCPCHEAAFDPAHDAAVLQGPARRPLGKLPIVVDQAAGTIALGG